MKTFTYNISQHKGALALLLVAFLTSMMGIVIRYLDNYFFPFQQIYLRTLIAFGLSLVLFRNQINYKKLVNLPKKEWVIIIMRSISFYAIGISLYVLAFLYGKYSNVLFIQALPATALFGFFLLKEKITPLKVSLVLLSFLGVVLVSVNDFSNVLEFEFGSLLSLISVGFFGFAFATRKFHSEEINNMEISHLMFLVGSISLVVFSSFLGESFGFKQEISLTTFGVLLISGLLNIVFIFLYNFGFKHTEAVVGANILTTEALFGLIISTTVFSEYSTPVQLIGGGMILIAAVLINKYG